LGDPSLVRNGVSHGLFSFLRREDKAFLGIMSFGPRLEILSFFSKRFQKTSK
jgi:hypothetical protein